MRFVPANARNEIRLWVPELERLLQLLGRALARHFRGELERAAEESTHGFSPSNDSNKPPPRPSVKSITNLSIRLPALP